MALSKIDVANMLTGLVPNDNTIRRPNSKPLIFNGDMAVSQRNGTTATTIGAEAYSLDRWSFREISNGTTTVAQTTTVPSGKGFAHSAKVAVTGADTSISADNIVAFAQKLEGQDAQVLKYGTSDAEKVTLSFYVKSNITGTYSATLRHTNTSGTAYVNSLTFSISSANTWEQKVLVFNGNTAQDIRNTNTEGLRLEIYLAVGSNFTSGGGANGNSWTTGDTNRASASNVNLMTSTDNDFFLTGVQMEVGDYTSSTLPPFQHESYDDNIARCYRYYYKLTPATGFRYASFGQVDNDDNVIVGITWFKTHMRAAPSALEQSGTASHYKVREATTVTCDAVPTFTNADTWYAATSFKKSGITSSNGFAQGELLKVGIDGGYLAWSTEL
jgi:hypothetical protein